MANLKAESIDEITQGNNPVVRAIAMALLSLALMVGVLMVPVGTSEAARTPVPDVTLPDSLDWLPEYHGQTLCSPTPKPGTLKLAALLDRTYGRYTKYFGGKACPYGLEHQEGRAIDWMVNSANRRQNAKAEAFIAWLLAKGPNGQPGANARRMGILYLVWNNRIWGVYRQSAGWRTYSNCTSSGKRSRAYNTSCHRDHVHITMTWDGANAQTSFWRGRAETRRPCPSSTVSRPGGSVSSPVVLMNTHSGRGLRARRCRLAGHTRYTSRSYTLKVPVPKLPGGAVPHQNILITRFQLNAPTALRIRSAGTVHVPQGAKLPVVVSVPLRRDGAITFSLPGGHARVLAKGLGAGAPAPNVTASLNRTTVWAKRWFTATGRIAAAPVGSRVVLQRKMGNEWISQVSTRATNGDYVLRTRATADAGKHSYRVVLERSESIVARSPAMSMLVNVAVLKLWRTKSPVQPGRKTRIRGRVAGIPDGSKLIVRRKLIGTDEKWRTVYRRTVSAGRYTKWLPIETVGKYRFRVVLRDPGGSYIMSSRSRFVYGQL